MTFIRSRHTKILVDDFLLHYAYTRRHSVSVSARTNNILLIDIDHPHATTWCGVTSMCRQLPSRTIGHPVAMQTNRRLKVGLLKLHVKIGNQTHSNLPQPQSRGVVLKKKWGGRLKQDLDKDFFKQFGPIHTRRSYTRTRQKNCHSGSLVLSCDTATRV